MSKVYICKATSSSYKWNKEYQALEYQPILSNDTYSDEWNCVDEDIVGSEKVEITLSELYRLIEYKLGNK